MSQRQEGWEPLLENMSRISPRDFQMTFAHILGQVDSVMISYKRASPSHCYRIASYEDALFSKFPGEVKPVLS